SVSALVRPPQPDQKVPDAVVAVGAPAIGRAARERVKQTAPGWSLRADDVLEREITAVTGDAAAQAITLEGTAATEAAVRDALPKAGIIHLAVPFRVNGASPLFSPVLLAEDPAEDSELGLTSDDGALEAREIVNLDLRARAAILTDPAALSMRDSADAASIVQWAWRAAGVGTLVVSRWAADEAVAADLLREGHRLLREG